MLLTFSTDVAAAPDMQTTCQLRLLKIHGSVHRNLHGVTLLMVASQAWSDSAVNERFRGFSDAAATLREVESGFPELWPAGIFCQHSMLHSAASHFRFTGLSEC